MRRYFIYYLSFSILSLGVLFSSSSFAQTDTIMKEWQKMNATKADALQSFKELKLGMFIHWGLYSIPAGIWQGKKMEEMNGPGVAEWIQLAAKIPRKEYAALADQFNPASFNADAIAKMAKDAGMKYIVITAKHHDGFAMYKSDVCRFNIVDATPFKRDVIAELYKACQKYGVNFGVYYSHNIDWADGADAQYKETKEVNDRLGRKTSWFGANLWDPSPNTYEEYLNNKSVPQVRELLKKFPHIRYMWFDMPELIKENQSFRFYQTVYDLNPKVIVAERIGNNMGDYAIPGDNKIPDKGERFTMPWEAIGTFNNSWGYKSYDNDWKSPEELLFWLVQIVSKGGNYMVNIGPRADGSVPEPVIKNLKEIGGWMKMNSDAIYGTSEWKISHEGPSDYKITDTEQRQRDGFKAVITPDDFWFTQKKGAVYVIALKVPGDGKVRIKSLNSSAGKIEYIEMPGFGKMKFSQDKEGLNVLLPAKARTLAHGYSLKVTISQ